MTRNRARNRRSLLRYSALLGLLLAGTFLTFAQGCTLIVRRRHCDTSLHTYVR